MGNRVRERGERQQIVIEDTIVLNNKCKQFNEKSLAFEEQLENVNKHGW